MILPIIMISICALLGGGVLFYVKKADKNKLKKKEASDGYASAIYKC